MQNNKYFDFTTEGYIKARRYLKSIGEWKEVSTKGFSTDGWSIIASANAILDMKLREAADKIVISLTSTEIH